MPTPLSDQLKHLAEEGSLWLDMPGHHGKDLLSLPPWVTLDRTEHTATGDLFAGGDRIEEAESLWASRWGAEGCLFLTGGSTQGNHTALHLIGGGETVLTDRGVHRSVWNSMGLLDLHPVFLSRPWDEARGCTGPITVEEVAAGYAQAPKAKAVILTSPTYYGVLSPIGEIADFCHEKGMRLIVDCAHGAHLPWIGAETPCQQGADLTVISAHKELPAPGQTALLLYRGYSPKEVRKAASVYGSSSPSYWMMAALETTLSYMEGEGGRHYRRLVEELLPAFWQEVEQTTRFRQVACHDPARLVITTTGAGYTGFQAQEGLEEMGIYVEMADLTHLVCITTCADGPEELNRFLAALQALDRQSHRPAAEVTLPPPPPLPKQVYSPREAMFKPRSRRVLWDAAGEVSAEQIAPYPPGVPVVAPGERIEKKHLAYLEKIGYNIKEYAEVLCKTRPAGGKR